MKLKMERGRILIPKILRDLLKVELNGEIDVECVGNKIVLYNSADMRSKEEILEVINSVRGKDIDHDTKLQIDTLKWVLNRK